MDVQPCRSARRGSGGTRQTSTIRRPLRSPLSTTAPARELDARNLYKKVGLLEKALMSLADAFPDSRRSGRRTRVAQWWPAG